MAVRRHLRVNRARPVTRSTGPHGTSRRTSRAVLVSAGFAVLVTTATVSVGVASGGPAGSSVAGSRTLAAVGTAAAPALSAPEREPEVSRSLARTALQAEQSLPGDYRGYRAGLQELRAEFARKRAEAERRATEKAVREADTRRYATEDLTVWSDSGAQGEEVGSVESGDRVLLTGREARGRTEVVLEGRSRWVSSGYFSKDEPSPLDAECTNGTSVPSGVSPHITDVHRAVCANFPEITAFGTFRSDGEHGMGLAMDIMVSGDRGWQVAEFLQEHYVALGIDYLIYSQQIWQPASSYSGWQGMEDRGSTTANHYDHVHVTTY